MTSYYGDITNTHVDAISKADATANAKISADTDAHVAAKIARMEFDFAIKMAAVLVQVPSAHNVIGVAYSGGLDSSALLHLMHHYAQQHAIKLFAFHVHHGLSAQADQWLDHCAAECAGMNIVFVSQRVQVSGIAASGVEAAARSSRYAALGAMCREHNVPLLLTAHHQDDQAETVLLQLLRGSGVAGLSGMDAANSAPELLGDASQMMARPLLSESRRQLADYVAAKSINHVDDASNNDPRFARNALRHQVMPALAQFFPHFQARVARSAQHAQSAQRLLIALAEIDHQQCADANALVISRMQTLDTERIDNLLRYWFGTQKIRMPSTAWLAEMRDQLFTAKPDAQLCVTHADCHVRRHRDRVYITPRLVEIDPEDKPQIAFRWNGESEIAFAALAGRVVFSPAAQGFGVEWLRQQVLMVGLRNGGERLKPAANRPTRALKYHYQAGDVPAWERERLPIVRSTTVKHLLFAAGIGMDCVHLSAAEEPKIALHWEFDRV